MGTIGIVLLVLLGLILFYFIVIYNKLARSRVRIREAWADIDVQLKRRYDLIPNLVETVKGYAEHEKETLERVLEARSKASSVHLDIEKAGEEELKKFSEIQSGLTGALGKIFALAEQYPNLKANENFLELQKELTDTEDKIQAARRFYNGIVRDYNTLIVTFPSNFVAQIFAFKRKEFFELPEDSQEREAVKVQF